MRGVAGEQNPAAPIGAHLPGRVAEPTASSQCSQLGLSAVNGGQRPDHLIRGNRRLAGQRLLLRAPEPITSLATPASTSSPARISPVGPAPTTITPVAGNPRDVVTLEG